MRQGYLRSHVTLAVLVMLGLLVVALGAVACGGGAAPTATPAPTPAPTATFPPLATDTPPAQPTAAPTVAMTPQRTTLIIWHDLPDAQATQVKQEISRVVGLSEPVLIDLQRYDSEETLEKSLGQGSIDFDLVLANAEAVRFMRGNSLIQPADAVFHDELWRTIARPAAEGVIGAGHTWAVPHTVGMQLMLYYNTALVPTPPADTAALIALARQFKPPRYALGMNALDPLWAIPWLSAYGGWPTDDAGRPTLNTASMTRTLTLFKDLAHNYLAMQPMADYDTGLAAFKAGQVAVWIDGDWLGSSLEQTPGLQWAVARLPVLSETGKEPTCLIAGKYFALSKQMSGSTLEAARLIVEQLVSVEAQKRWAERFKGLPAAIPVLTDPVIQNDPFRKVAAAEVLAGRGVGLASGMRPAMEAMRGPIEDVLSLRIMPDEAARGMQARADAMLSSGQ